MGHKNIEILTKNSVVLITGGAKGITSKCSIEIAKTAQCNLILIGRSILLDIEPEWSQEIENPKELEESALAYFKTKSKKVTPKKLKAEIKKVLSSREIQNTLQMVSDAGAAALYISADVTDLKTFLPALEKAVAEYGKISGIIHGAGNLADKRIENKTADDFNLVVNTKTKGLENILKAVDPQSLKFLVLFSSVAGFYGNTGQTDYAIANEILNTSAHIIQRSLPECRVISINWGPWDSGMVSSRLKKFFEAKHIQLISTEYGVRTLIEELTQKDRVNPQIVIGNQMEAPTDLGGNRSGVISIQRKISHKNNPFLNDHSIGPQAVLPATCASAWLADTCRSIHPGFTFSQMEDFKILKGLTFKNDTRSYDLELKLITSSNGEKKTYDVQVTSEDNQRRVVFHYSGRVTLLRTLPDCPAHPPVSQMDLDEGAFQPGADFYLDGTLFHGPAFRGIQQVLQINENRIITKISLPNMAESAQGQFTVLTTNPFVNDAAVQSLLLWTQKFYDAPCLPSRLHQWDHYRVPPFDQPLYAILNVTYHNENAVVGDICVQDEVGKEFYTLSGLEGTVSKHLKRFFSKKISSPA